MQQQGMERSRLSATWTNGISPTSSVSTREAIPSSTAIDMKSVTLVRCLSLTSLLLISACAPGFLYTHITRPLTTDMVDTPRGTATGHAATMQLKDPITRIRLSAEWRSRSIGDAIEKGQLAQAYYADLRTVSILGGLWSKREVVVYGDRNGTPTRTPVSTLHLSE